MIHVDKFTLENGLRVIVHRDISSPIAAVNILYDVGARDEAPGKTGFAHLFEHLMFGGSVNIPVYDEPLQRAGGENNAFTSNDITNYYLTLPKENLETGFWLESDRMLGLGFSQRNLDIQKNVVIEEFKQRYLNQPYGDVWLLLRPLVYKMHPYMWPTIGKEIKHIENANLNDVKSFFYSHYAPNNAIITVAGDVKPEKVLHLAEKWFGNIEPRKIPERELPAEPRQTEARKQTVYRDVPLNAIFKAFHMCHRNEPEYHAIDLTSDVLANGLSSRLYQNLVKKEKKFSEINAYITGSIDPGLFIVSGKIMEGIEPGEAEISINNELNRLKESLIDKEELEKVKNKVESTFIFSEISILNKAINLTYYELIEEAEALNNEINKYRQVSADMIRDISIDLFNEDNCSTLYYFTNNK